MAAPGEMAELLVELQALIAEESDAVMGDSEAAAMVNSEPADVMIYLICLAHEIGVDLVQAGVDKLADSDRRYPVDRVPDPPLRHPHRPSAS